MARLAGKIAVITGGSSGIGLATAQRFAAEGAHVFLTGRNQENIDKAVASIGESATGIRSDVSDDRDLDKVFDAIDARGQGLDVVFANAGIPGTTPIGSTTLAAVESIIRTNITSVFFTVQAAVPHSNDGASIILNGSVISVLGNPGYSAYAASKAGVRAMARVMASELSPRNIRVNVVAPGATRTPIWGAATATPDAEKAFEKRISLTTPLGRMGEADHVAKTVLFLASDDSNHSNGSEFVVDGAMTA